MRTQPVSYTHLDVYKRQAWTDAGFSGKDADSSDDVDPLRLGVAFGTGIGGVWTLLDGWDTMRTKGHRRVKPMTVPMLMPNGNASSVSMEFKARACACLLYTSRCV